MTRDTNMVVMTSVCPPLARKSTLPHRYFFLISSLALHLDKNIITLSSWAWKVELSKWQRRRFQLSSWEFVLDFGVAVSFEFDIATTPSSSRRKSISLHIGYHCDCHCRDFDRNFASSTFHPAAFTFYACPPRPHPFLHSLLFFLLLSRASAQGLRPCHYWLCSCNRWLCSCHRWLWRWRRWLCRCHRWLNRRCWKVSRTFLYP